MNQRIWTREELQKLKLTDSQIEHILDNQPETEEKQKPTNDQLDYYSKLSEEESEYQQEIQKHSKLFEKGSKLILAKQLERLEQDPYSSYLEQTAQKNREAPSASFKQVAPSKPASPSPSDDTSVGKMILGLVAFILIFALIGSAWESMIRSLWPLIKIALVGGFILFIINAIKN